MNYLVTDLECTCTNTDEILREEMEVIEIGAVLLDENFKEISRFSSFVKPEINPILTNFCKELTKIKQSDVDNSPLFEEALNEFSEWAFHYGDYKFLSWGSFDYNQINRETKLKLIKNPLIQNNINYKKIFAKQKNLKNKRGVGVRKALSMLNYTFEGTPHRAIYDARNIARIVQKVRF